MLIVIGGYIDWHSWELGQWRRGAGFMFGAEILGTGLILICVSFGIW